AGTRQYSLTVVACSTISLSPATLPNGTVGDSYSQTFTASGGISPYSFMVDSGSLPPGLTLSHGSGAVLSGTPTSSGSFTFTIQARDSYGCTGTRQLSLTTGACPTIRLRSG